MSSEKKILVISFQSLTKDSAGGMARLGFYISDELNKRGLLHKFIVYSKGKFNTDFPSEPVSFLSRYILFLLNNIVSILRIPAYKSRFLQEYIFDMLCVNKVHDGIGMIFTTNAYMKRTFRKAQKLGIPIIYVPANPEENYICKLVEKENKKIGIDNVDAYTYRRRLKYYNDSISYINTIVGTYPTVYNTYKSAQGSYNVEKIIGHLKPELPPCEQPNKKQGTTFHIAYLAHSVMLKGLQYLLEAWKEINKHKEGANMHLHIAGEIDPTIKKYIDEHYSDLAAVTYAGYIPCVAEFLQDKDLFVVPSIIDGGPYTALEAAHCSLPIIITENCGSAELLNRGQEGCRIVPTCDATAIAEQILWAYNNRDEASQIGENAKNNFANYRMSELITPLSDYLQRRLKELLNTRNMGTSKKIMVASFQSLSANSGAGMARLGYYLSAELQKLGVLKTFVVHSKGKFTTSFPSEPVSFTSRYYLFILNKLNKIFKFKPHKFRYIQELIYDWFLAKRLDNSIGILFVTTPFLKRTFIKAKKLGIRIILLSGTPEENYIYKLVSEENKKLGVSTMDAYTYPPRLKFFNESVQYIDSLIGSLPTVYRSYLDSKAFKGEIVEMTGHMPPDFKPVEIQEKDPNKKTFKVGYLAHTVVLKGLHYLLEAWQDISKNKEYAGMELLIAGGIDESMDYYIQKHFKNLPQVKYIGHLNNVSNFLQELDLFVVPSLVDGGPVAALEAAHYAVPVLITKNAGSYELLSRDKSGCFIIPIQDTEAIKEKIIYAYTHREESIEMGWNAKHNLENYSFIQFMNELAKHLEKELIEKT